MTHVIDSQSLIDLDAVSDTIQPMARLALEPNELSKSGEIQFRDGFDGLDYLVFAQIDLTEGASSYLVRHQNAPEAGTLIYLEPGQDNLLRSLTQSLQTMGLSWENLDWLQPELEQTYQAQTNATQFRRSMEGNIQLVIEGSGAEDAAKALVSLSSLEASYEKPSEVNKEAGTLAVIATVVGIVGGSMAIAEQIRKWYQEYKQANSGKKIEKVLIVGPKGQRILLEHATLDEIRKMLEN